MSTSTAQAVDREIWISGRTANEILQTTYERLRSLAKAGRIRTRQMPGSYTRYAMSDCVRLAENATSAAESNTAG